MSGLQQWVSTRAHWTQTTQELLNPQIVPPHTWFQLLMVLRPWACLRRSSNRSFASPYRLALCSGIAPQHRAGLSLRIRLLRAIHARLLRGAHLPLPRYRSLHSRYDPIGLPATILPIHFLLLIPPRFRFCSLHPTNATVPSLCLPGGGLAHFPRLPLSTIPFAGATKPRHTPSAARLLTPAAPPPAVSAAAGPIVAVAAAYGAAAASEKEAISAGAMLPPPPRGLHQRGG